MIIKLTICTSLEMTR